LRQRCHGGGRRRRSRQAAATAAAANRRRRRGQWRWQSTRSGVRCGKSHRRRGGDHCDVRVRVVHYGPAVPVASRRGRDHRVCRQRWL